VRTWFFGKREYAYAWLRWVAVPLLRIGILLVAVPIMIRGHSTWVSWFGAVLLAISLVADGLDFLVVRARRRQHAAP
jgi:hypothetical protein